MTSLRGREVLSLLAQAAVPGLAPHARAFQTSDQSKPDITLQIGSVSVELAPKKVLRALGYNGTAPGPLLRMPEGEEIVIDVRNQADHAELVHWHGLRTPSLQDGSTRS